MKVNHLKYRVIWTKLPGQTSNKFDIAFIAFSNIFLTFFARLPSLHSSAPHPTHQFITLFILLIIVFLSIIIFAFRFCFYFPIILWLETLLFLHTSLFPCQSHPSCFSFLKNSLSICRQSLISLQHLCPSLHSVFSPDSLLLFLGISWKSSSILLTSSTVAKKVPSLS